MDHDPLGLIGLGLLGSALAERFLAAGHTVCGYDIASDRRDQFQRLGSRTAASAGEVARACRRTVLSLPNSDVVENVVNEMADAWCEGVVVIDTTTGDPERTTAIGQRLAAMGVRYLDATVVGSSEQVRVGDAVALVGGEQADCAACAALFACFAREWFHVGACGSGARMKLAVNLVLGLNRAVLAEGLTFAAACGLDPSATLRVLQATSAYSRVMDVKGRKMIERDFRPQARLAQHLKDVRLILAAAERSGATVPLSEAHRGLLESARAAGLGDRDNSAIITAFAPKSTDSPID
jgi:3-hydroxyisobutyrate dehydrogenase-like beta-hydroxyacid dehydrogenase